MGQVNRRMCLAVDGPLNECRFRASDVTIIRVAHNQLHYTGRHNNATVHYHSDMQQAKLRKIESMTNPSTGAPLFVYVPCVAAYLNTTEISEVTWNCLYRSVRYWLRDPHSCAWTSGNYDLKNYQYDSRIYYMDATYDTAAEFDAAVALVSGPDWI